MSAPAAEFSAAEFVKTLSDEQKEAVLYTLLEEGLVDAPEPMAISLAKEGGPVLAYLLSPTEYNWLQREYQFPHADDPDYRAKRIPRSERNWITFAEILADWEREDEEAEEAGSEPVHVVTS